MKTKITPANKAANAIRKQADGINKSVGSKIGEATLLIHANAVKGIATQSAGETQVRYNPRREVVASKPGDPPNVDFGVFLRSVQFEVDVKNKVGYVGTNDKRGVWFEFGTRTMKARPWLGPAIAMSMERIKKLFKEVSASDKGGDE